MTSYHSTARHIVAKDSLSPRCWIALATILFSCVVGCSEDPQHQPEEGVSGGAQGDPFVGTATGGVEASSGDPIGGGLQTSGGANTSGGGANTNGAVSVGSSGATGGHSALGGAPAFGGSGGVSSGGTESGGVSSGGTDSGGTDSGGTDSGGTDSGGTHSGGTDSGGTDSGGTDSGGTDSGGADSGGADSGGTDSGGTESGGVSGGAESGGVGGAESGGVGSAESGGVGGAESGGEGTAGGENRFRVYLLIGQSNMAGGAETEPRDLEEDARIKVLGYDDCAKTGRVYNEWDEASPPLHACWSDGIGPGDYFAKTLIEALPEGDTIGLVPCAIPGVDIDFFVKGVVSARRGEFTIPPDNHWDSAYDWVIERARLAQAGGGVIDGVIFHQGESDSGEPNRSLWADKVKGIVEDLRADLGGDAFPFVAGELLYSGCCGSLNSIVNQLPDLIPNAYVASGEGLSGVDQYHFDAPGVRTIGQRYGEAMIEALGLSQ